MHCLKLQSSHVVKTVIKPDADTRLVFPISHQINLYYKINKHRLVLHYIKTYLYYEQTWKGKHYSLYACLYPYLSEVCDEVLKESEVKVIATAKFENCPDEQLSED